MKGLWLRKHAMQKRQMKSILPKWGSVPMNVSTEQNMFSLTSLQRQLFSPYQLETCSSFVWCHRGNFFESKYPTISPKISDDTKIHLTMHALSFSQKQKNQQISRVLSRQNNFKNVILSSLAQRQIKSALARWGDDDRKIKRPATPSMLLHE